MLTSDVLAIKDFSVIIIMLFTVVTIIELSM